MSLEQSLFWMRGQFVVFNQARKFIWLEFQSLNSDDIVLHRQKLPICENRCFPFNNTAGDLPESHNSSKEYHNEVLPFKTIAIEPNIEYGIRVKIPKCESRIYASTAQYLRNEYNLFENDRVSIKQHGIISNSCIQILNSTNC